MERTDISVARFPDHAQAEVAVKALTQASFDMKQLSIIGRGYHTEDNVSDERQDSDSGSPASVLTETFKRAPLPSKIAYAGLASRLNEHCLDGANAR